jgi:enolase
MIKDIILSEIYNSCKDKTIKVSIKTEKGIFSASPPSGTSTGKYEAKTLGIEEIKKNFPKVKKKFIGREEKKVDKIIEKIGIEKIGSNLSLALSIAAIISITKNNVYKFFKKEAESFPYPLGNTIGGGAHSGYLSEQEFLILPIKAKTINEAVKTNLSIWKEIGKTLKPFIIGRNRENAWICKLNDLKSLETLSDIAKDFGVRIGIDFAANNIYKDGRYYYRHPDRNFSPENQLEFVLDLIKNYKLAYIEDPFIENDFEHFAELTKKAKCLVAGDDLFATQSSRLKLGIKKKAANTIIIKPNQTGTVSRTLETVKIAKKANYVTVVSHRSCETNDSFIADLAVGIDCPIIKCAIYGKEREAKFKRLEEIWNKTKKPKMASLRKIFI